MSRMRGAAVRWALSATCWSSALVVAAPIKSQSVAIGPLLSASTFRLAGAVDRRPRLVAQLGHSLGVSSVAFYPHGRYALLGSAMLWDVATGQQVRNKRGNI